MQEVHKIAVFCASMEGGGAEKAMLNLIHGLVEKNFSVDLILVKAEGLFLNDVSPQVRIIDFKAHRTLSSFFKLARYLRQEKPQVLLSALDHVNLVAIWAGWISRARTRIVISVHHPLSLGLGKSKSRSVQLMMHFVRWFYPKADCIVAVSKGVYQDLIDYMKVPSKKICTIYNPILHSDMETLGAAPVSHAWFQPNQPPVVLAVGRLSAEKDYPTMIRAFQIIRRQRPLRLLILGDGDQRPKLQTMIQELKLEQDVQLTGFVANPYPYMKKAACFALSSTFEGFGNVLVEALAMGCPVVSTNCPGGPPEILENGKWGQMVPVGDDQALAKAILLVLDGKTSLPAHLPDYLRRFDIEEIRKKYIDVFNSKHQI